jgi:hypothetical protein
MGRAHMGEIMNTYKIVAKNSRENKPLGRFRRKWGYNIKRDLIILKK